MPFIRTLFCLLIIIFASCSQSQDVSQSQRTAQPDIEFLTAPETAKLGFPFSEAVRVGNMLYLSGQIGTLPGTDQLATGGIQGETRQTMENIKRVLEENGSSLSQVVKVTVMLADISEWPALNEVYVEYFPNEKPARSAFAGSGLALNARCEIEVIAVTQRNKP